MKFIRGHKRSRQPKSSWDKSAVQEVSVPVLPGFKLYNRATLTKTAWYWHTNRYKDQWDRIEAEIVLEIIDTSSYSHMFLGKHIVRGIISIGKDRASSTQNAEDIDHSSVEEWNQIQVSHHTHKNESQWTKDLSVTHETLKPQEGNTQGNVSTSRHAMAFRMDSSSSGFLTNEIHHVKKPSCIKRNHQLMESEKIFSSYSFKNRMKSGII